VGELTVTTFVTADGVMQAPGGSDEDQSGTFKLGGWLMPHFDEQLGQTMQEIFSRSGAFLLGRATYDIFAKHWPNVTDPNNAVASRLNSLPKYIASRTRNHFAWKHSTHVSNVVSDLAQLKSQTSGELQVHGSCGLLQTLIENDLIDEYRLIQAPVVLGEGKRLFGSGARPTNLRLVSSTPTSKGVVVNLYRRGGVFSAGAAPKPA
jgi:dihydrofolate reductase